MLLFEVHTKLLINFYKKHLIENNYSDLKVQHNEKKQEHKLKWDPEIVKYRKILTYE